MKAVRWVTGAVFTATLIAAYAADNRASAPAGQPVAASRAAPAIKFPSLSIGARQLRVKSLSINNGVSTVGGHQVTLNNACSGSPTHCMASEKSSFQGAFWQVYSTAPAFTLSPSNGTKTVYFRIMNAAGKVSAAVADTVYVDEPQIDRFEINNGAGTTISRDVTLNNTCLGSLTHYLASESSQFKGADWQAYSTAPAFALSGTNGVKTVWFKVKNAWGVSTPRSDTIMLNEVLVPEVTWLAINNGSAATTTRSVTLNNTCANSPTECQASENAGFANASWQPYSPAAAFLITSNNGPKTVWFRVRNARGESAAVSDAISLNAPPTPPDMVPIPAGSFTMGNSQDVGEGYADELPTHSVYVMAFHMDRHEVTKALWDEVATWAAANGYDLSAGSGAGKAPNHPVQSVTWHACVKWCNARSQKEGLTPCYTNADGSVAMAGNFTGGCDWSVRGYRLPTEAEWERAARVGAAGERFPWSADTIQHASANYFSSTAYAYDTSVTRGYNPICNDSIEPFTAAVGSFPATSYGLYDVAGNVAEWCWDWFDLDYYGVSPASEPRGPSTGVLRVTRGGSWFQDAAWCRVACRGRSALDLRSDRQGFRTVRPDNPLAVVAFAVNGGAATATSRTVTLNNTCAGGPTEYLASELATFSGAVWLPYGTAPVFALSGTNGTKTVWLKVRRSASEESTAVSDTIVLAEPSPPRVLSFAINDGATATTARNVTLNNVCTNGPLEYMASEDASFSNATWKAYSAAPAFTLQGATGTRTVWFKVRNTQGVSATASDSITLNASPTPPDMVLIPAGSFKMGNSMDAGEGYFEERPTHTIHVSAFYADRHEVTKALWDEVAVWAASSGYDIAADSAAGKDANHPVQHVTWHSCLKWCNARSQKEGLTPCYTNAGGTVFKTGDFAGGCDWSARGYRLPTEAEWEKAARGGIEGRRFPWSGSNILHTSANYYSSTAYAYDTSATRGYHPTGNDGVQPYTSSVGTTSMANGFGLYDVAGNVMEWCWDRFDSYYYGSSPASDPRGPSEGSRRVLRGGSWFNDASSARVASRASNTPDLRSDLTGFRSVRSDRFSEPVVTSFEINAGADATTNRTVTLNHACTGSPTEYLASENADFSGASWQAYSAAPRRR